MATDRLDMIIFGATGFTGKYAVQKAVQFCKEETMNFGVAGRRKEAIEDVLKEFASDIGKIRFTTGFLYFLLNRMYLLLDLII